MATDRAESVTVCYDCTASTSGRCWRHNGYVLVRCTCGRMKQAGFICDFCYSTEALS